MQIDYDPQADAIYIRLRDGKVDDTREVSRYIYVDVDQSGMLLGLEILFAKHILTNTDMISVTLNIGHSLQVAGG